MKITLNLATRPYTDHGPAIKQLRIAMAVLAGVSLLFGLGLLHFHKAAVEMAAKEAQLDHQVQQVQREQAGYRMQMQQPANARVLQQAQFLNSLFDEKAFSWTGAMEDLEQVLPAGVQVTAIEPSRGKDGRITLHLRVTGLREQAVTMVRHMEHSNRFVTPRISGENAENNSQSGLQPVKDTEPLKVSFDVLTEYNPATLEERAAATAVMRRAHPGTGIGAAPHGHEPKRQGTISPAPLTPQTRQTPSSPQNPRMHPGQGEMVRPYHPGPPPGATPVPQQENPQ